MAVYPTKIFRALYDSLGVQDIWRRRNPAGRDYTCTSRADNSLSRIDLFLTSNSLELLVTEAKIANMTVSDHAPIFLTVAHSPQPTNKRVFRFPTHLIKSPDFIMYMKRQWDDFMNNNRTHISSPTLFWETAKAVLRGNIIAYLSKQKRLQTAREEHHNTQLTNTYTQYCQFPTPQNRTSYFKAKKERDTYMLQTTIHRENRNQGLFLRHGNRAGNFLASLVKIKQANRGVPAIKSQGQLTNETSAIVTEFTNYYTDLYQSQPPHKEAHQWVWHSLSLPTITEDQLNSLNAPISPVEVTQTIKSLALGKTPGLDGLPTEFYRILSDQTTPVLTTLFDHNFTGRSIPSTSFSAANITVIHKQMVLKSLMYEQCDTLYDVDTRIARFILKWRLFLESLDLPTQRQILYPIKNTIYMLEATLRGEWNIWLLFMLVRWCDSWDSALLDTISELACIVDFMEPREVVLMKPVQLKIKSKFEDHILVLTIWRAFLLQPIPPLRVESTFNYLEISDIEIRDQNLVVIDTDSCVYPFNFTSLEDLEHVILHVITSIKKVFPDSSPGKLIRKTCLTLWDKFSQIAESLEEFIQNNQGPCGGFSQTYAALCDYNGFILREEVQWDVDNIYHSQDCREFRLLDFSHLDTSDVALTVASLSFNQWFTKLHCKDFKLRLEITEQILYMISRSLKLEELVLENCGLKCDFAIRMAQALDTNSGSVLHTINLSGNQVEDRGIIAFSRHFEKHHKGIKYLNFSKTSITSKGIASLFQSFASNDTFSNSLLHLDLSGNPGILATEDSKSLYHFLGCCKSLNHLNLADTDCALDSLFESLIYSCCSSLVYLNVSRNIYSHRKVKDVRPAIMQFFSMASALTYLDMAGTRLPAEALRTIFQGLASNNTMRDLHLDLSDCELRSLGAQVIQDMIVDVNPLSSLNISGNGFDSEMVTLILSISRSISLKHVSLGRNFNLKPGTSLADVLHRIVQLIQDEDSPIQSLSLADSRLKSGTSILLNALGSNSSLTKIDISGNAIGDTGAKLLAKALQINSNLRTVIWDRNNTTASGFLDVAHALERNYTLCSMPFPLSDVSQAYRMNPVKTEEALHKLPAVQ
ncbi:capping protein, Arp2/3 and myosin-I linker protein 3-like [Bombina bombina]|uniref:capping protein, Arp2/3 and myosin-I linker protein 3-like n=1 Tax=Bombina bombina TaxID=8345 RepID=UPI00235B2445|nr:capping protein, Arp2/3 and myosin-I linker protein 3-like [Bombina bombina]